MALTSFLSLSHWDACFSLGWFQERQKQLESLGISLQSSGIKVGDDKCFLVNLNADPALNELLVYYLKVTSCSAAWFCLILQLENSLTRLP